MPWAVGLRARRMDFEALEKQQKKLRGDSVMQQDDYARRMASSWELEALQLVQQVDSVRHRPLPMS